MNTKPMAMLLQDPSMPELQEDYQFPLDKDYLAGMSSSKFVVQDTDAMGMEKFKGLDWSAVDTSFAALNEKQNFIDNPQFHQVNTFSVASHTLDFVETALGREMKWKHGGPLVIRPHAITEPNAYYDPSSPSLNFGYFNSGFRRTPIWTCLSHDIIAHELGHAILDSFRPMYVYAEEPDTGALHESLGDLLSLFSALEHKSVVERLYRESGGDMNNPSLITGLAEEFGIGLQGVNFPFLRSALNGQGYNSAPEGVHERSTLWTAAIYEILAKQVQESLTPEVNKVLGNSPVQQAYSQSFVQQASPEFESYYTEPDNRSSFEDFFAAIVTAARRVKGMTFRALQDLPPTGVSFPLLAQVMVAADARLFPDDAGIRDIAKAVFSARELWIEEMFTLEAPDIGEQFEALMEAGPRALMLKIHQHAEALQIPLARGATILEPVLHTVTRHLDTGYEARGEGVKTITEHYLYYSYELLQEGCLIGPDGQPMPAMISIFKGGTLVMDENWKAIQLSLDLPVPDYENMPPEAAEEQAFNKARRRFTKIHRHGLRAYRDGRVDSNGLLADGSPALPFKVQARSSGHPVLMRHTCHLHDHLRGIGSGAKAFPFDLD